LSQQYSQDQNQYFQMLQHEKNMIMQKLYEMISECSKKIAKQKSLKYILNEDACFFYQDSYDLSDDIVKEMDLMHDQNKKPEGQGQADSSQQKK
jgi:Skp family chaperone for outer membrane proteins